MGVAGVGGEPIPGAGGGQGVVEDGAAAENIEATPEQSRERLGTALREQNKQLGGHLLTEIPISPSDSRGVLIFKRPEILPGSKMAFFGVHPELGPISLKGNIAVYIDTYGRTVLNREKEPLETPQTFEEILQLANEDDRLEPVVNEEDLELWGQAYGRSRRYAEAELIVSEHERSILPRALDIVSRSEKSVDSAGTDIRPEG